MDSLWLAYDMAHANGIVTTFSEVPMMIRSLIDTARRDKRYDFDEKWLDSVYQRSLTYAKRLALMVGEHKKAGAAEKTTGMRLSRREAEVLRSVAQGLTREEIARECGLSVNTIKSTIKNVYNKLGAVNRADAVRIASAGGLIE